MTREYALVVFVGLPAVVGLFWVIAWALERRGIQRAKDRLSAHAHCKHGARVFGVKCHKCYQETEAFFAETDKTEVRGTVPWVSGFTKILVDTHVFKAGERVVTKGSRIVHLGRPYYHEGKPAWECRVEGAGLGVVLEEDIFFKAPQDSPEYWVRGDCLVCAQPTCSYKQSRYQPWGHSCAPAPLKPRFKVGQWVRYGGATGTLCYITTMHTDGSCSSQGSSDAAFSALGRDLEYALPAHGEVWRWTKRSCPERAVEHPVHWGAFRITEAFYQTTFEATVGYEVACGCLEPVNFGKGGS